MEIYFYETVINQMSEGVVVQDHTGSIIKFNQSALHILGLTEDQILGRTSMDPRWQSIHEDGSAFIGELHPAMIALKTGKVVKDTIMGVRNGECQIKWISINASPIFENNKVTHAIATFKDITEDLLKKKRLEQLQFRLDFALSAATIGIWDLDLENNFLIWDDRMFEIYGVKREDFGFAYNAWEKCVLEEDKERANNEVLKSITDHTDLATKFKIKNANNEIRVIETKGKVQLDQNGKPVRFIGVNWDITEAEKYNEELIKLKLMAEEATLAKSVFLANTGHEIRTPLNGILGSLEILDTSSFNDEQKDILNTIRICGNDLLNLLNNVLDLSKLEIAKVNYVPTNLASIFEKVAKIAAYNCEGKGIKFLSNYEEVPLLKMTNVKLDELKLSQVLNNLLNNAIKFTHTGEVKFLIKCVVQQNKLHLEIVIKDSGIGISKDNINKLFTPFEQLDSSIARKYGGSGLGLVIVKKIIDQFGGTIKVNSQNKIGAEFILNFCFEITDEYISKNEVEIDPNKYAHLKILLVDDNEINIKVISKQLQKLKFSVDTAFSGGDAILMAQKNQYDLILMDLQMPIYDGYHASRDILNLPLNMKPKIIALSANLKSLEIEKCHSFGISEFCQKPFNKNEFFLALSKIFE